MRISNACPGKGLAQCHAFNVALQGPCKIRRYSVRPKAAKIYGEPRARARSDNSVYSVDSGADLKPDRLLNGIVKTLLRVLWQRSISCR